MPSNGALKQARYMEKMRNSGDGKYEIYKMKEAAAARNRRQRKKEEEEKMSPESRRRSKEVRLLKARERKQRWLLKKQFEASTSAQDATDETPVYKTLGAKRRAVSRAKEKLIIALPKSPRKKKIVVRQLLKEFASDGTTSDDFAPSMQEEGRAHFNALPVDIEAEVVDFFNRDDISRQAPGRKDVVTVKSANGEKNKIQARHLTSSLLEAYAIFKEEFPTIKIGKSKFCSLRPKHVLLSSQMNKNVCLCRYHENFKLAIEALNKAVGTPKYSSQFTNSLVCTDQTPDCWNSTCENCKTNFEIICEAVELSLDDITWHCWRTVEEKMTKTVETGTVMDLISYIKMLLPQFLKHVHTKRQQEKAYKADKSLVYESTRALLQVDFAENYTCTFQDEVQSAHWNQSQVSLFTACVWISNTLTSKVIVSDNLTHAKETILAYLCKILDGFSGEVDILSVWSDGPASQFKNKYIAAALARMESFYGLKIKWNFFATSHGKGPVDGVGGSIKRSVWNRVKTRQSIVKDAASFCNAAKAANTTIDCILMTNEEIEAYNNSLNVDEIFSNADPIYGVSNMHMFQVLNGSIEAKSLSDDATPQHAIIGEDLAVGEFCLVQYDGVQYPGRVEEFVGPDFRISAMEKSGNSSWKWPSPADILIYQREDVVKKISFPVPLNSRNSFTFYDL